MGDTALRMLAATVNEAMMSIPPPSKPNHTAPHKQANLSNHTAQPKQSNLPDYNGTAKRENPGKGASSIVESVKKVSTEASTIAAKKAPSKSENSQAAMNKFMLSMANPALPASGSTNSSTQQIGDLFVTIKLSREFVCQISYPPVNVARLGNCLVPKLLLVI